MKKDGWSCKIAAGFLQQECWMCYSKKLSGIFTVRGS